MLDGRLISVLIPGAITEAAPTAFSGIFASLIPVSGIVRPPTMISFGGGEGHSWSLHDTASPNRVAMRRDKLSSGSPLSIQAWSRRADPLGSETAAFTTTRLGSLAPGTATEAGSAWAMG